MPVGTELSGGNGLRTYQIGAARGKGGFGITYIALEVNSGRRVAIKEYYPTRCAFRGGNGVDVQAMTGQEEPFQSGMDSFMKEAKMLLSQDDLSCVVHVIDYFQANGTAYLAMEYLDGVPLHTQMTRMGGRIPVNELMPRLALLIRDIGQLHQRGVIHRDISPDNIMWMPDGGLKLLDFGSARSIMESGKSMTVLMKQGFSPIEQYRTRGQGPYTDVYALAATIYYCVTGVIPQSSMERLGEDLLQLPTALGAALTTEQETALLWALSIQPEARPQTMEEFAARLYKEEQPQQFVPAEPPPPIYSTQPNSPPQPVQPSQIPPQPVQPSQIPPQSATERNTAYQYGQSYTGQSAGQYTGQEQNWTGGGGGGKKKNKLIPVVAALSAVVVLLIGGLLAWRFIDKDKDDDDAVVEHSSAPSAPSQSTAPAPPVPSNVIPANPTTIPSFPPVQNVVTGVTDDGFVYEIVGGDHVVLTGCETDAEFYYMPDDVDGIPITEIADGAFAGATTGGFVNLPFYMETIGANAFRNCEDLSYVYAYSNVETESSSFSGCDNLWFVAVCRSTGISGWRLPSGVSLYYAGMDTGYGRLNGTFDLNYAEDVLTAETEEGKSLLLDAKPSVYIVDAELCDWICPWALDNPPYAIYLGENTLFPYEAYSDWNDWAAPEGSMADMWLLTCEVAAAINDARPVGAPQIEPDEDLIRAAQIRANELAELYDSNARPNGEEWHTAVSDSGIDWTFLGGNIGYRSSQSLIHSEVPESLTSARAAAITAETSPTLAGQYFTLIGVAYCLDDVGDYCFNSFVMIPL